jgi:hypothetical protein
LSRGLKWAEMIHVPAEAEKSIKNAADGMHKKYLK